MDAHSQGQTKKDMSDGSIDSAFEEDERYELLTSQVILRKKKEINNNTRSERCSSVVIEPTGEEIARNKEVRRSMYELRSEGWTLAELNDRDIFTNKNKLNIDEQVNEMLLTSSSVNVILGGIKLTF